MFAAPSDLRGLALEPDRLNLAQLHRSASQRPELPGLLGLRRQELLLFLGVLPLAVGTRRTVRGAVAVDEGACPGFGFPRDIFEPHGRLDLLVTVPGVSVGVRASQGLFMSVRVRERGETNYQDYDSPLIVSHHTNY